ncbi:hypothetical protein Tco_1250048, partial [Tanacetum coccineum]
DCPDCEDSQFCHSSRVSHPQLHLGIPISYSSRVSHPQLHLGIRYPNLID